MEYTYEQLDDIIGNQLTERERAAILNYIFGYMGKNSEFTEAVNSALTNLRGIFVTTKLEVKTP